MASSWRGFAGGSAGSPAQRLGGLRLVTSTPHVGGVLRPRLGGSPRAPIEIGMNRPLSVPGSPVNLAPPQPTTPLRSGPNGAQVLDRLAGFRRIVLRHGCEVTPLRWQSPRLPHGKRSPDFRRLTIDSRWQISRCGERGLENGYSHSGTGVSALSRGKEGNHPTFLGTEWRSSRSANRAKERRKRSARLPTWNNSK